MAPVVDEPQRLRTPLQCWHESLVSARTDPLVVLSSDGAFIATDRPVPVGTPLFLELSAHGDPPGAEVDAVAIAGAGPAHGFAVRFVALDDAARRFIAAQLAEEQRATAPDATLVPREVPMSEQREARPPSPLLAVPVEEPPPPAVRIQVPVAPIELSLDDTAAAPLSADDLDPVVPEPQAPVRDDAIELGDLDLGAAEAPAAIEQPAVTQEPPAAVAPSQPFDDALALSLDIEIELEPPAMAAMPSPPPAPSKPPAPAAAPWPPAAPAPVPEAEQTIKWARASAAASAGPVKNPFATGDSGSRPMVAAREQTERFAPAAAKPVAPTPEPPKPAAPASAPAAPVPPARLFMPAQTSFDEGPERIEQTERWIRPTLPSAPTPAPAPSSLRSEIDDTRPWTRANLTTPAPAPPAPATPAAVPAPAAPFVSPPRARTPSLLGVAATPLPEPTVGAAEPSGLPRAPMPRIASMEVPGSVPPPDIEQTQRWPTAKVRVANAPLELPVGDVPFARPPDMPEHTGLDPGLEALFPDDGTPAGAAPTEGELAFPAPPLERRLEVEPALERPIVLDESFEPEPVLAPTPGAPPAPSPPATAARAPSLAPSIEDTLPLPAAPAAPPTAAPSAAALAGFAQRDETAPLPSAPAAGDKAFGPIGGLLGADDDFAYGGNAGDLFGGAEVTDPGHERAVPATAEDGFEAPDDIGPTLEAAEPLEVGEPLELTSVEEEEAGPAMSAAPVTWSAPPPVAQVAPSFALDDAEAIVTAEIPAETQVRLLEAALSRPSEAAAGVPAAPAVPVRTDPFFDRQASEPPRTPAPARPEPKPTQTQPYFTLGGAARSLPPLPPPPPAMTKPPPLPTRPTPAASPPPAAAPPTVAPQRTDPFFPRWSDAAGPPPPPQNPFAGLQPIMPANAVAPLLGNALPAQPPPAAAPTGDTFFDDLAFEVAEQHSAVMPPPADHWQVQGAPPPPDELPTVVGTDDLPTVVGRTATPSSTNPWLVGEPAKKG